MEDAQATADKMAGNQTTKTKEGSTVPLDKFKRRLVRAVARLMKQNMPENDMWAELKKEIGCDCKMLWQHMRALTMKKLKRLLPANDLLENLNSIARFTATDWLLFDLILVHEKMNVISIHGQEDDETENKDEPQCLYDLFELVKEHNVEEVSGDELVEAWIRVTLQYNSRGRQCSPMLLQLRWYQMKELSRVRFYNFWFNYHGNTSMIERAMKLKPTDLQVEIAQRYNKLITKPFPDWATLIEERRVILSEEFTQHRESKVQKAQKVREVIEEELQLIEPQVETIELEVDSDEEPETKDKQSISEENSSEPGENKMDSVLKSDVNKIDSNTSINDPNTQDMCNDVSKVEDTVELDDSDEEPASCVQPNINKSNLNSAAENQPDNEDGSSDIELIPCEESNENESISEQVYDNSMNDNTINVQDNMPKIVNVTSDVEFDSEELVNVAGRLAAQNIKQDAKSEVENVKDDSDEELNEILREKARNLSKIHISQVKSEFVPKKLLCFDKGLELQAPLVECEARDTSQQSISNDEIDKILQDKASQYTKIKLPQTNVIIEGEGCDNPEIQENNVRRITINEDSTENTIQHNLDHIVKLEKPEEGLEEYNFDDDQIEFVDDGIELKEESKELKIEPKSEPCSDSDAEDSMKDEDYPKIDLKLLMNPTVYTKRIDQMNIFKCNDYNYVFDKSIIECALIESKPVDKLALKPGEIDKFREHVTPGNETDDTQSVDDAVQHDTRTIDDTFLHVQGIADNFSQDTYSIDDTDHYDSETVDNTIPQNTEKEDDNMQTDHDENRVKCTSWLLQKPKKRSYNPIQLCKNPDFNTRLKRFTAGFLSSTRNRELLKECQPLTIDLHKSFEKKLVDGTLYLKGGDFKSAKSAIQENTITDLISVVPSTIPGIIHNAAIAVKHPATLQQEILPLSSVNQKQIYNNDTSTERRKIINLPDIDQVRRFNQSLLTAEVTPIRIDNNISFKQQNYNGQAVDITLVQPVAPTIQIKKEPSEIDIESKIKLPEEPNKALESVSVRNTIVSKINDQIINLSHQIAEVETSEPCSADVNKTVQNSDKTPKPPTLGRPSKSNPGNSTKGLKTKTLKTTQPSGRYAPKYRANKLSWAPKYADNYIEDSLLTADTLNKMMTLIKFGELGQTSVKKKKNKSNQLNSQRNTDVNEENNSTTDPTSTIPTTTDPTSTIPNSTLDPRNVQSSEQHSTLVQNTNGKQPNKTKKVSRKKRILAHPVLYEGIYCCWARERIIALNRGTTKRMKAHGCLKFRCSCCCRYELVELSTNIRSKGASTAKRSKTQTIVLSDDDDIIGKNDNEIEVATSQETFKIQVTAFQDKNETSDNILNPSAFQTKSIQILTPPATQIVDGIPCGGNLSEKPTENIPVNTHALTEDQQKNEADQLRGKSCKITVRSAPGNSSQKCDVSISITAKNSNSVQSNSIIPCEVNKKYPAIAPRPRTENVGTNVVPLSCSSNENTRTMFLNSSQIINQPTKGPIYLGAYKILLCSLKTQSSNNMSIAPELPALPNGVNFVLTQSGELEVSIDPNIQLDSEQLSALPGLLYLVQQQLIQGNVAQQYIQQENCVAIQNEPVQTLHTQIETQIVTPKQNDVYIQKENCEANQTAAVQSLNTQIETQNVTALQQNALTIIEEHTQKETNNADVSGGAEIVTGVKGDLEKKSSNLPISKGNELAKDTVFEKSVEDHEISIELPTVVKNKLVQNGSNKVFDEHQASSSVIQIEKEITETQCNVENLECMQNFNNLSHDTSKIDKTKETENESNNTTTIDINSRKTILSDLMEMSGISAEDASMPADESNNCAPIIPLPPTIIPMIKVTAVPSTEGNLSITGPNSNLLSYEPTTPVNRLLNLVGHNRPELNAVTSFAELKYVYENDGQFYKLDSRTGSIVPINVCIKKNVKSQCSQVGNPKAFIDLTEDAEDDEISCAEFQEFPASTQISKSRLKPVKLFKAVHPNILKRNIPEKKTREVIYPKKTIRVTKQKPKRLVKVGNRFVLVVDGDSVEFKQNQATEGPPPSNLDCSYDSSDEEPLAKKSKRQREIETNSIEKSVSNLGGADPHSSDLEEIVSDPVLLDTNAPSADVSEDCEGNMSDLEMSSMDIEGVNPELHPVAFEEGSESDEDMCILGV